MGLRYGFYITFYVDLDDPDLIELVSRILIFNSDVRLNGR